MAYKLLIYSTAFLLTSASISDLFIQDGDESFNIREFSADIDIDKQEELKVTIDYEIETELITLYFVITHEQEDMVIEFNYALDLSDPLEAQWVDQ